MVVKLPAMKLLAALVLCRISDGFYEGKKKLGFMALSRDERPFGCGKNSRMDLDAMDCARFGL